MSPKGEKRQSLRGGFLRVTIPLIFLSVVGVFTAIELLTYPHVTVDLNIDRMSADQRRRVISTLQEALGLLSIDNGPTRIESSPSEHPI